MLATACTGGAGERVAPTTVTGATTTFVTLPPVGVFTYPTAAGVLIAQISADDGGHVPVPLLTVYGDGLVVAAVGGRWLTGAASDLDIQEFFGDAKAVGLLDGDLVLRGVEGDAIPDIAVYLDVDGRQFRHELDLARIERPVALRAFLQRAVAGNVFGASAAFEPDRWLTCTARACTASTEPTGDSSRPVLLHEDLGALTAGGGDGGP